MALFAIPSAPDVVRVAFGGEASTLAASVRQAIVNAPGEFLADVQLSAGGTGGLWEAVLAFTDELDEATPIAPLADLRVRAVQAGTRAELETQINRAIAELLASEAITWIPKIVIAGAGGGAVFCALVFGSVGVRPTGPGAPPNVTSGASQGPFAPLLDDANAILYGIPLVHTSQTGKVFAAFNITGTWGGAGAGPSYSTFAMEGRAFPGNLLVGGNVAISVLQLLGSTVPSVAQLSASGWAPVPVGVPLTYDARLILSPQALATALTMTLALVTIVVEDIP